MKRCPQCRQIYIDETLRFCRNDGTALSDESVSEFSDTLLLPLPEHISDSPSQLDYSESSIAVLPFANLSADAENEYFCDGLAEELLNSLAKIDGLKVAARTSSFSFKNKHANISQIGNLLKVKTVLEGSVRKSGKRVRITLQLVNTADGYHLWSERYDRNLEHIFDVQDEITQAVTNVLRVMLLGKEKSLVLKHSTTNTKAYEFYLRGRYQYNKQTPEGLRKSIEYFEQAIEHDQFCASAYAGIAISLGFSWWFCFLQPHEIFPKWQKMVATALEIDDESADAHMSLANLYFSYEWKWTEAEREYRRTVELFPYSGEPHCFLSLFLASQERFEESVEESKLAIELDPLSVLGTLYTGWAFVLAERMDEAQAQAKRLAEIAPEFYGAYWLEGIMALKERRHSHALEAFEKAVRHNGTPTILSYLGYTQGVSGNFDAAQKTLNQLLEIKELYVAELNIARVYSGLGEIERSVEWLEKAVRERNGQLVFLDVQTKPETRGVWGENCRYDPRFAKILRQIKTGKGSGDFYSIDEILKQRITLEMEIH